MCLLPRREPVVEHYPCAAERLPEGVPVPRPGVKTVVVPEQHKSIILGHIARYEDIHTGRSRVFATAFVTSSGIPMSLRDTWSGCRRSRVLGAGRRPAHPAARTPGPRDPVRPGDTGSA